MLIKGILDKASPCIDECVTTVDKRNFRDLIDD